MPRHGSAAILLHPFNPDSGAHLTL